MVDRSMDLPLVPWPASFAPVAVVRPTPRPTAEQLPPLTPRAPPVRRAATGEEAPAVEAAPAGEARPRPQWTAHKAAEEAAENGAAADADGDAAGSGQQARPRPRPKREPEAAVQEPSCPMGHPLVKQKVSASRGVGFECEGPVGRKDSEAQCSHVFAQGDWKHGCVPCDYDLCAECVASAWPAPGKRSRP